MQFSNRNSRAVWSLAKRARTSSMNTSSPLSAGWSIWGRTLILRKATLIKMHITKLVVQPSLVLSQSTTSWPTNGRDKLTLKSDQSLLTIVKSLDPGSNKNWYLVDCHLTQWLRLASTNISPFYLENVQLKVSIDCSIKPKTFMKFYKTQTKLVSISHQKWATRHESCLIWT